MHIKVAVINATNYFVIQNTGSNRYEGLDGTEFELLKILSKTLNFTYEIVCPEDGEWGILKDDGNWSGMVGMIHRKEADMAIEGITLSHQRAHAVGYAFPYFVDYTAFMMKKAGTISRNFFLVHPFQPLVWVCFMACLLLCSLMLSFLQRNCKRRGEKSGSILKNMLSMLEILIGSRNYGNFFHRGVAKIVFILSAFPFRVLMFAYTGLLLSFLMTPAIKYQIKTFEELAKSSRSNTIKVTAVKGSFMLQELKQSRSGILGDLSKHLHAHPDDAAISDADIFEKVRSDYALADEKVYLQMMAYESGLAGKTFVSEDGFYATPLAILFRKNFCCIGNFNKVIFRIYQSGVYQKLLQDQLFKIDLKRRNLGGSTVYMRSISITDLSAVFKLLTFGYAIATATLFYERYSDMCKRKRTSM